MFMSELRTVCARVQCAHTRYINISICNAAFIRYVVIRFLFVFILVRKKIGCAIGIEFQFDFVNAKNVNNVIVRTP